MISWLDDTVERRPFSMTNKSLPGSPLKKVGADVRRLYLFTVFPAKSEPRHLGFFH
jgi:hypothetical protein